MAGVTNTGANGAFPNNIYYALNANNGKAVWASDAAHQDPRTSQFLAGGEKGTLADFAYGNRSRQYLISAAPIASLPEPELALVEDHTVEGVRNVRLRLASPRQAAMMSV